MFTDLLPVKVRKIAYAVYGSLGYVIGSIAAAFLAIGHSNPQWFAIAIAVYAYLAGPFGKLAGDNTGALPGSVALPAGTFAPNTNTGAVTIPPGGGSVA